MSGLRLIATAPTPGLRRAEFGGDHPLDEGGTRAAHALRPTIITGDHPWVSSPAQAARQTAKALGREPARDETLRDPSYGQWTGLTLDQIDPTAWLTDPTYAPPGGESLTAVTARTGQWLDRHTGATLTAVAHPVVVRALLTHALGLPAAAIWQLDIAPLAVVRLTHRASRWHLHLR